MNKFERTYREIKTRCDTGYWTEFEVAKDTARILLLIAKELHELNKKKEN